MSNHFTVITVAFILIVGIVSFFSILQDYKKHRKDFIRSLLYFIFFYNIYILALFIYHYFLMNLYKNNFPNFVQSPIFAALLILLLIGSTILYTFYFFKTNLLLQNKKISKFIYSLFLFFCATIFGILVYSFIFIDMKSDFIWLRWFLFWLLFVILCIILLNIYSIINSIKKKSNTNSIKQFSFLYLFSFILVLLTVYGDAFQKMSFLLNFFPFSLLLVNINSLIWYKFYYLKQGDFFLNKEKTKTSLNILCEKHKITAREREIIEQILIGKSNKEISDILFISINTVKTYTSKIFQKFSVKSRNQLTFKIIGE